MQKGASKSLFGLLGIAIQERDLGETKRVLEQRKESGAYTDKSHKVVKSCLARSMIDSDTRKEIFILKGYFRVRVQ